jgi:hypothetical protein
MISRKSSAKTAGPLSMAFPEPLNTLPNMSSETGVLKISPVNSHVVCLASIPDVPSKTLKSLSNYKRVREAMLVVSTSMTNLQFYQRNTKNVVFPINLLTRLASSILASCYLT